MKVGKRENWMKEGKRVNWMNEEKRENWIKGGKGTELDEVLGRKKNG